MTARAVRMNIPESTSEGRTAALVQRDRDRYPSAVEDVLDERKRGDKVVEIDPHMRRKDREPELSEDTLIAALGSEMSARSAAAAFVAGRSTTDDAAGDAAIKDALHAAVDSVDTSTRLGRRATAYVEGVMSLALLGDEADAIERFTAMVTHPERRSDADHLAAGYLAQLGRADGYPVLLEDLHDKDNPHGRMLAIEQVTAFLAYDGQSVGRETVDVRKELKRALQDKDDDVGLAAVRLIAEARLDDMITLLESAADRPHPKKVRAAAKWTLEQLG